MLVSPHQLGRAIDKGIKGCLLYAFLVYLALIAFVVALVVVGIVLFAINWRLGCLYIAALAAVFIFGQIQLVIKDRRAARAKALAEPVVDTDPEP